jgi:hypothetical protein
MVTRVDKFLGGLGADVTSVANVHATQNRITFGGLENPSANAHVIGTLLASTNAIVGATAVTSGHTLDVRGTANTGAITATTIALSADGGVQVPNDGNIGSAGATDAMQISSGGIVTFKDDIKIKDGGTIGSTSDAAAITIAASGQVTFSDVATFSGGLKVPDDGDIGSASVTDAIQISSAGIVTFKDDILIKDGGTIGVASKADAVTIAADGDTAIAGGLGIAGNTAPVATALSLGTPANVVVRTHTASGAANVIIGDATVTSAFNLDVRGTANTGALTASGLAFPTSDGSANEVLKTDGSGTLSFTAISSNAITSGDTVVNAIDPNITFVTNGAEEARITAAGNLVLGSTTATHLLDVRGTANTGVLTASGLTFPSSDGSADQAIVTDGSGALSFATVLTSSDPSTTLAATPDLGSVASGSSQDAFGQNLGGLTETDLLDEPTGSLSTLDAGALS